MRILVIGASGLLGGNCHGHFNTLGHQVVGTHLGFATPVTRYFNTLNAADPMNFNVDEFQPEVVVHCGALTHVDYCEQNESESFEKTVTSAQNAAELAVRHSAIMVYIGTDYVFDGKRGFYRETDEPNPLSVYARHKWLAEEAVRQRCAAHLVCRVTNVYGDEIRGKNFVARLSTMARNKEATVLNLPFDQYATPINAADGARAIAELLRVGATGTFHLASTDTLNRVQLAELVCRRYPQHKLTLNAVSTAELNQPAPRPLAGGFSAEKFNALFPHFGWTNVSHYLNSLPD